MVNSATELLQAGVKGVYASSTHAVLSGGAVTKFEGSPIHELVCTDTIPFISTENTSKIKIVSVDNVIGEAIYRIHRGMSVGAMFDK